MIATIRRFMLIGAMESEEMRLTVNDLSASRGGRTIFENVGFDLSGGQGLLVTGPNGAGKSTLLRAIAGYLPVDRGFAAVLPENEPVSAHAHYLNFNNAMKAALTVFENLEFHQQFGGQAAIAVEEALNNVGLLHLRDNRFGDLSTGQRRRVALARLLLNHRPIWLVDEPTTGLDKASEQTFARILDDHMQAGGIVVAATHLPINVAGLKSLRFEEEVV
ncbi:MAG: heme ABC exporter ATP-binding protein CcmA [Pseudomonadota bacterium]